MASEKTAKNKELFEHMPVPKAVATMAIPAVVSQLIILIYNVADTYFIGRTENPLMVAGASLILPVFNITGSIACIMGVGGSTMISRLLGAGKEGDAKKVFTFSLYFSGGFALLFSLGTLLFMKPLLMLLGAGLDTYKYAYYYALCVVVFGSLPTIMTNVLAMMTRSIGESGKAGFGVTMGGIINMILDPIVMFLILPKGYEIIGAGIATFLSNCITCTYFIVLLTKMKERSVLRLTDPRDLPSAEQIKKIFVVGVPSAVATFLFDVDYIVIDKLMSTYSDVALAAVGIVLKAERLPLNIGIGICQGMVPIIGYNYAAKNYERMRKVARFAMGAGLVCALVSIAMYEGFAPFIMRFFINSEETVALGTRFLRVRALATILMFMSFYHVNLFNGYGRGQEAMFLGVTRWAVFNIPMLYLFNALFGMMGIVWAQAAADCLTAILSLYVHRRYLRKHLPEAL